MAKSSLKMIGDWKKVRKFVGGVSNNLEVSQQIALKRWGLLAEKIAVQHISNQDLGWEKLKQKTITDKVKKGYSEKVLVRSSTYLSSITSYVKGSTVYAGVKKEAKYASGEAVANIAAVHEFSSKSQKIPARPLWQPTLKEVSKRIRNEKYFNPVYIFSQKIRL